MRIASGRASGPSGKPTRLTLKAPKRAKTALRKARKVGVRLEVVAGTSSGPQRRITRNLTLRR